jgi:hypothetical protein
MLSFASYLSVALPSLIISPMSVARHQLPAENLKLYTYSDVFIFFYVIGA